MISMDVRADIRQAQAMLRNLRRDQIPFATAYALTQTAKDAQEAVERKIAQVFDNPTPFTLKAVRTRPATKRRLQADVLLKDEAFKGNPAVRWLIAQVRGGPRDHKGFERLMQRAGVMPNGWYAVPTKWAPLDRYGNVPGGVITRILSQLQASRDPLTYENRATAKKRSSMRSKVKKRGGRYFAVVPGSTRAAHLSPGIWERITTGFGSAIRPVFVFSATAPTYTKRLPFYETIQNTVRQRLKLNFARGFNLAQSTARPIT